MHTLKKRPAIGKIWVTDALIARLPPFKKELGDRRNGVVCRALIGIGLDFAHRARFGERLDELNIKVTDMRPMSIILGDKMSDKIRAYEVLYDFKSYQSCFDLICNGMVALSNTPLSSINDDVIDKYIYS